MKDERADQRSDAEKTVSPRGQRRAFGRAIDCETASGGETVYRLRGARGWGIPVLDRRSRPKRVE